MSRVIEGGVGERKKNGDKKEKKDIEHGERNKRERRTEGNKK
jgi:hypothetical protein